MTTQQKFNKILYRFFLITIVCLSFLVGKTFATGKIGISLGYGIQYHNITKLEPSLPALVGVIGDFRTSGYVIGDISYVNRLYKIGPVALSLGGFAGLQLPPFVFNGDVPTLDALRIPVGAVGEVQILFLRLRVAPGVMVRFPSGGVGTASDLSVHFNVMGSAAISLLLFNIKAQAHATFINDKPDITVAGLLELTFGI